MASSKVAIGGIARAVARLLGVFKRAPEAWQAIVQGLGLEGASLPRLVTGIKELMAEGKAALGKALGKAVSHIPLSLFFVDHEKMPGLTDLMQRLIQSVPWLQKALAKIHEGADYVDDLFKKHIPVLRRPIYAAVFIYVWISVFEITWDMKGLIAGFTGQVSLSELLGSMPESALGALFANLGLGTFAALPVTLILRLAWLTSRHYLEYKPGKGFIVLWDKLGIEGTRPEVVPA